MKKDIKNRKDIEKLVNAFYAKIKEDKLLQSFFTNPEGFNWEKHLNTMYNFWENMLFFSGNYEGNPLHLHRHLHQLTNIKKSHIQRWNKLFSDTVDELYAGKNADLIKKRSINISNIIQKNIIPKEMSE